ncbi:type IV secretion system protein VirB2 [endosymbiont of Acanthamoeba sp. UWC8]|nr:TrbC/VirB2 family protein [Candidatus Jidaibacter acanthamoeba]AIF81305.1 type IV secretion system protein VirB2 [endosymbiont of Acanthamoeba sp. UWC8]MBA8667455.1 TrbC/VirB2 family protein [Holosporaceae bacterium 'Namur']
MQASGLNYINKNFLVKIIMVIMLSISALMPTNSYAQGADDTKITETLCNAVNQLTGNIGRSIAILIVISLAIMLFLGKVTWGVAIAVGVGMGILFGAPDVVQLLSGGTACKG